MKAIAVPDDPDEPGREVSRRRAEELSQSRLMPEHFANNPANVQYAMEIGQALGIDPVMALSHIHVFADNDGKLKSGLSADLMVALVRNAGHIVHIESRASKATATLIRTDITPEKLELLQKAGIDPKQYMVFTATWTETRAMEMGLTNSKRNWKLYTPEMMAARVKSSVVRLGASEVLLGVRQLFRSMGIELTHDRDDEIAIATAHYTPDELGVETDEDGAPVKGKVPLHQGEPEDPVHTFVRDASADEIAQWAENTSRDSSTSLSQKMIRFHKVYTLCEKMGRLDSPLHLPDPQDGTKKKVTSLNAVLASHIKPIRDAIQEGKESTS